jgi:hypothetical protein
MLDPIDVFLLESPLRLKKELMNVTMRLICDHDTHVPDTLTRIRVLPTVAVVGQKEKVQRSDVGATLLDIYVKFLPKTGGIYSNLKLLGKMIKGLPGIQIVKFFTVGGKTVTIKGKPIVL